MIFANYKIRSARKHDAKKVATLFADIDDKIKEKHIESLIEDKRVFVVKKKKKIKAAFAYSVLGLAGILSFMYIKKIAVSQDERGKGLGSFLLQHIQNKSKKKGITATFLYSLSHVKGFYKKNKLENWWRFFWWKH